MQDFNNADMGGFVLFGNSALFTEERVNRNTVPKGLYAYDIGSDENDDPTMVANSIRVDFLGTVFLKKPLEGDLTRGKQLTEEDWSFESWTEQMIKTFISSAKVV